MAIRIIGRLAAVVMLGILLLGAPLTAAAVEASPTTEDGGATATSDELACDCMTEPTAGEVALPDAEPLAPESSVLEEPDAEPLAPESSVLEEPAAESPVPTATDPPPAPQEPLVDPTLGDSGTIGEPSTVPMEEVPLASSPAEDGLGQPEIESPPDATSIPTDPPELAPPASAPPAEVSEVSASPASSALLAAETQATQPAPVPSGVGSRAPFQSGSATGIAPWAATQAVAYALTGEGLPSGEGTVDSVAPTAPDAGDRPGELGRAGARPRTADPTAFETTFGVEQTVTASIAIMAPRGVASTVSVAVEFGRAGNGWAGAIVFNVWLRRQMRERRMSQRQLAVLSGVDHSTISRLVRGDRVPSLATATRLARALGRVDGDGDGFAYFARLPEETVLPTTRVEMALRGDDEINDDDVRSLMIAYLDARTRRRRARQLSGSDITASLRAGAADQSEAHRSQRRAQRGRKDAIG
jgi:transcriptional regulator with XRE-family HTH domain